MLRTTAVQGMVQSVSQAAAEEECKYEVTTSAVNSNQHILRLRSTLLLGLHNTIFIQQNCLTILLTIYHER